MKHVVILENALREVKEHICRSVPDSYSQDCVDAQAEKCDKIIDEALAKVSK